MLIRLKHLILLLLALPALAHAAPPMLTPEGYGAVRFGMPIDAAEKAVGQSPREPLKDASCQYVEFRKYPGVYFMLEDGVVVRADTDKSLRNSAGARKGMDIKEIKARHPREKLTVQASNEDSVTYAYKTQYPDAALVLYTTHGRVRAMWAGIAPAYSYYEGCM